MPFRASNPPDAKPAVNRVVLVGQLETIPLSQQRFGGSAFTTIYLNVHLPVQVYGSTSVERRHVRVRVDGYGKTAEIMDKFKAGQTVLVEGALALDPQYPLGLAVEADTVGFVG